MIKIPISKYGDRSIRIPFFKKEWRYAVITSKSEDDFFSKLILDKAIFNKVGSSQDLYFIDIKAVLRENENIGLISIGCITQSRICDDMKHDIYSAYICLYGQLIPQSTSVFRMTFLPGSDNYGIMLYDDLGYTSVESKVEPHYTTYHNGCCDTRVNYRYYNNDLTMIHEEGTKTGDIETPTCRYHYDDNGMLTKVETFSPEGDRDYDITYLIQE